MHDRKMIKWAPFNSVINGNYLLNTIEYEKDKITKPLLSDEQISNMEKKIFEAMINNIPLEFTIYKGGHTKIINDNVIKIDSPTKRVLLARNKWLYFCEIMMVKNL